MPIKNVSISQEVLSIQLSDLVVQTTGVVSETLGDVLELASRAGVSLYSYTGEQLTSITYSDFNGIASHSKTLSYTGEQLTSTSETFTYGGKSWQYDVSFMYTGEQLTSKSATLTII